LHLYACQCKPNVSRQAALFSAIKSTFSNTVNDFDSLSSFTKYPSLTIWMQTPAYPSVALSCFATFWAVVGKQWLNYYKAT
ncbi:hypothetical protein P692DRAFT_20544054, partial [Suillus brevipes Sb2]